MDRSVKILGWAVVLTLFTVAWIDFLKKDNIAGKESVVKIYTHEIPHGELSHIQYDTGYIMGMPTSGTICITIRCDSIKINDKRR